MTFRWYGESDPVKIEYIKQIPGMHSIVSAVYGVPAGEVWSEASILHIKNRAGKAGLNFEVVESVPVHEDIKLGKPSRDLYIANYIENIKRLSKYGVRCVCYNFMPVFDWTRTQLDKMNADGSTSLVYYAEQLKGKNPLSGDMSLPGWDSSYRKEDLKILFDDYGKLTKEDLWSNLEYFLKAIIPVAERYGIKMAIHPDDPPWDIFGLPRLITDEKNIDRFLKLYDSKYSGLTFCTGSLGCAKSNDVVQMIDKYSKAERIHFMHIRNVRLLDGESFEESAHYSPCGSLDVVEICKVLHKNGFDGYIRPDHGRMIWDEIGKPGYGLYDRALGAMYITGIFETLNKTKGAQ
ncbi:mannonate dehydratase [Clostridia bacterium]|nr:mannonate dehydratase [Clostridia bacterium]